MKNAPRAGSVGSITYTLQVSSNDSFTAHVAIWAFAEQGGAGGQTTFPAAAKLPADIDHLLARARLGRRDNRLVVVYAVLQVRRSVADDGG